MLIDCSFGKKFCKNQLYHILLYRTIYCCIVIQSGNVSMHPIVYHYTSSVYLCVRTCMCVYVFMYVYVCMFACVHMCVCSCSCVWVCVVGVGACVRMCVSD